MCVCVCVCERERERERERFTVEIVLNQENTEFSPDKGRAISYF